MSGLMRDVVDQVLRSMGAQERAEQVNYVTDRMIEQLGNEERVALLLAIIDRVMSNLSAEERVDLAARVARRLADGSEPALTSMPEAAVVQDDAGAAAVTAGDPPHPRERD